MRDAHVHLAALGRERSLISLADVRDRGEAVERVRRGAEAMRSAPPHRWLCLTSARPEGWSEPRWLTRDELDVACPDRACLVSGFDHHSGAVNTPGLEAAGFTERSPDPEGGVIVRDAEGRVTGLLLESAYNRARCAVPEPGETERRAHVLDACRALRALGFVETIDMLSQPWLGPVLKALDDAGELPLRVTLYVPYSEIEEAARDARRWTTRRVVFGGAKLFADGSLNSTTAWVLHPYKTPLRDHPCGTPLLSVEQLTESMRRCERLGVGLAVHAIGDGAVRAVLDAREVSRTRSPLRIEHLEIVDKADVPRFASLGVIAGVQPCHLLYDVEVLRRQLPHRLNRVLPLRELIDSGLKPGDGLQFGSDAPIVRAEPEDSIQAAVHRRRPGDPLDAAIGWDQRITEAEAGSAFAAA